MVHVGEIKAIIDEDHVVILASVELSEGDKLTVFSSVKDPRFLDFSKTDELLFPIGEIQVLYKQEEKGLYIAKRFRELERRHRTITRPSPLVSALSWAAGETKEVLETIPGDWSAAFDSEKNLGINIPKVVTVGDAVGRK